MLIRVCLRILASSRIPRYDLGRQTPHFWGGSVTGCLHGKLGVRFGLPEAKKIRWGSNGGGARQHHHGAGEQRRESLPVTEKMERRGAAGSYRRGVGVAFEALAQAASSGGGRGQRCCCMRWWDTAAPRDRGAGAEGGPTCLPQYYCFLLKIFQTDLNLKRSKHGLLLQKKSNKIWNCRELNKEKLPSLELFKFWNGVWIKIRRAFKSQIWLNLNALSLETSKFVGIWHVGP
jgi:hypothetical protein